MSIGKTLLWGGLAGGALLAIVSAAKSSPSVGDGPAWLTPPAGSDLIDDGEGVTRGFAWSYRTYLLPAPTPEGHTLWIEVHARGERRVCTSREGETPCTANMLADLGVHDGWPEWRGAPDGAVFLHEESGTTYGIRWRTRTYRLTKSVASNGHTLFMEAQIHGGDYWTFCTAAGNEGLLTCLAEFLATWAAEHQVDGEPAEPAALEGMEGAAPDDDDDGTSSVAHGLVVSEDCRRIFIIDAAHWIAWASSEVDPSTVAGSDPLELAQRIFGAAFPACFDLDPIDFGAKIAETVLVLGEGPDRKVALLDLIATMDAEVLRPLSVSGIVLGNGDASEQVAAALINRNVAPRSGLDWTYRGYQVELEPVETPGGGFTWSAWRGGKSAARPDLSGVEPSESIARGVPLGFDAAAAAVAAIDAKEGGR